MNKQSITKYAVAVVLGLGVVLGVSSLQAAWTTPAGAPPGSNVDAPINVGANSQSKLGQLFVNTDANTPFTVGLSVFGKAIFNGGVQILSGAGANKILTSDASGNATWQTPASVSGGSMYCTVADTGTTGGNAWKGVLSISLLKDGVNMCTDGAGCVWTVMNYDGTSVPGYAQNGEDHRYYQNPTTGAWFEENDSGTKNGDTTVQALNNGSYGGIYDDMTNAFAATQGLTSNVTLDSSADTLSIVDISTTASLHATICDRP